MGATDEQVVDGVSDVRFFSGWLAAENTSFGTLDTTMNLRKCTTTLSGTVCGTFFPFCVSYD